MATERTLILIKPDAFERGLTGEIIARFERKGLRVAALTLMQADEPLANVHYEEHTDKPFFGELVEFITRGPLVAMILEGPNAIKAARSAGSMQPRSPSISSTDPTPPSRPSARSGSGSPTCRGRPWRRSDGAPVVGWPRGAHEGDSRLRFPAAQGTARCPPS